MLGRDEGIRLVVPIPWRMRVLLGSCALGCLLSGCAPSIPASVVAGDGNLQRRPTGVEHQPCDVSDPRATTLDANGDGRGDVAMGQGEAGACRGFDLDFDGVFDSWVYLDAQGRISRREIDYDSDGIPDEIQLYAAGQLREKQLSTIRAGQLDTWLFFTPTRRQRTERDTNGDGIIDEWWFYGVSGCASIRIDDDADGRPDPASGFEQCENQPFKERAKGAGGPNAGENRQPKGESDE